MRLVVYALLGAVFLVTVLKVLVGLAVMEDLKREMAILATSGTNGRTGPSVSCDQPLGKDVEIGSARGGSAAMEDHRPRELPSPLVI